MWRRVRTDVVALRVLQELGEILPLYREGLQKCVSSLENEYRSPQVYSYEVFAWFLDNYVRSLTKALMIPEERITKSGTRERRITTDKALYGLTRLLVAYLEERSERYQELQRQYVVADGMLMQAVSDVARRVFQLDLSIPFNRKELLERGMKSQPLLRDMALDEGGIDFSLALDPIKKFQAEKENDPGCFVLFPSPKDKEGELVPKSPAS